MSWKFVFNSSLLGTNTDFDTILKLVLNTGYEFFTFEDYVYFTDGMEIAMRTGITVEDLF